MQTIEGQQIDAIFLAMRDYEKSTFGMRLGIEFPQVAQALATSAKFRDLVSPSSVVGMLSTLLLPRGEEARAKLTGNKDAVDQLIQDTPLREMLAEAFFAGFKLGSQMAEVKQLEALASNPQQI